MSVNSRKLVAELLEYLRNIAPNHDFDVVSSYVNEQSEKELKAKKIYYLWKQDKTVYEWVIKAVLLAAIKKGWIPSTEEHQFAVRETFFEGRELIDIKQQEAVETLSKLLPGTNNITEFVESIYE